MKASEIIDIIKYNELIPENVIKEIIQKLLQFDELKLLAYDTIESMELLYEFLFEITGDME